MDQAMRDKIGPLALRLALGLICFVHGFEKIRVTGGSAWHSHLPVHWQLLISWAELVGAVMVVLGMQCRYASATLVVVIITETILKYGWNLWQFPMAEWETTLIYLFLAIGIAGVGGGEWILDLRFGGSAKPSKRKAASLQPSLE